MHPRSYLSFSQMTEFEMSPQRYADKYLYGERQRISRNMAYGSKMAQALEIDEASGDPLLDLVIARLPKFDRMDLPVEIPKFSPRRFKAIEYQRGKTLYKANVPVLKDRKIEIPILALPDTAKSDYSAFKEYKTSVRKWTQKMANESGQITFYATAIWLATGEIPEDIELVNAQVDYQSGGKLQPTGEIICLRTARTLVDIIRMTGRIKRVWAGIKKLTESELL